MRKRTLDKAKAEALAARQQSLASAYSALVRKVVQPVDALIPSATNPVARANLRSVMAHLYAAEDEMKRAIAEGGA